MRRVKKVGVLIVVIMLAQANVNVKAQEIYVSENAVKVLVERDVNQMNEQVEMCSIQLEEPTQILRKEDSTLAIFEEEKTTELGVVGDKVVCKNEKITVFAAEEGYNSRLAYVPGGSVKVAHYYTLDSSNNRFQMIKSTFTYSVNESKYRFTNVKAGYRLRGQKPSGGEYSKALTWVSYSDKTVGTKTEVITVNSPIILYNENPLKFEIASVTTFTVKDLVNGTLWDKEIGFYSISS